MKRKVSEERWLEAAQWRGAGMNTAEIALKLGITQSRVSQKLGKRRAVLVPESAQEGPQKDPQENPT